MSTMYHKVSCGSDHGCNFYKPFRFTHWYAHTFRTMLASKKFRIPIALYANLMWDLHHICAIHESWLHDFCLFLALWRLWLISLPGSYPFRVPSATLIPKRSKPASVGRDRLVGHCNWRCTVAPLPFDLSRTITVCAQSLKYPVHSCVSSYPRTGNKDDPVAIPKRRCSDSRLHSIKRRSCTAMTHT